MEILWFTLLLCLSGSFWVRAKEEEAIDIPSCTTSKLYKLFLYTKWYSDALRAKRKLMLFLHSRLKYMSCSHYFEILINLTTRFSLMIATTTMTTAMMIMKMMRWSNADDVNNNYKFILFVSDTEFSHSSIVTFRISMNVPVNTFLLNHIL